MGRKKKLENYDAVLRSSYRLFMAHGYDNITTQDIAEESNVQSRNFYRYFKNKEELLGVIIETVEKQMIEYLKPLLTDDPLYSFVLFSIMKHEYAINNPDYFRMRASLIARPETFIKCFMDMYSLSYPQNPDWKSDEETMLRGLYILGGTMIVQYGFLKNISSKILSGESSDFMTNYNRHKLSKNTSETFRRFMNYAIRNNLHILGLSDEQADKYLKSAYLKIEHIGISGFRQFYETALGFI